MSNRNERKPQAGENSRVSNFKDRAKSKVRTKKRPTIKRDSSNNEKSSEGETRSFRKSSGGGKRNSNRSFGGGRNGGGNSRGGSNNRRGRGGNGGGKRGGGNKKYIPVEQLIHVGVPVEEERYDAINSFADFPLHEDLKRNVLNLGYTHPTEIQEKTFKAISEVRNVLGIANTGTGKTAAFLIPIINAMLLSEDKFSALVIVPTRELALQVEDEFRKITRGLRMYSGCFIGGQSINNDFKKLRKPFDFVIGTPGRLVDLSKRKALKFEDFSVLILDEFDRMLDMGFSQDVNFITDQMTNRDQTLLFSATLDKKQKDKIDGILEDPITIKVTSGTKTAQHIDQDVVYVNRNNKYDSLVELLNSDDVEKVIVFAETKMNVSKLTDLLKKDNFKVDEIHGDKTQNYRKHALANFKRGKINILLATDVAARGLDISDVTHVINYQVPQDYETYIHRIGRTGRAGKAGKALTFVNENER